MTTSIPLPKLGESIVSATVVQWFKKPGDRVKRDEPLLEVSTDKVNSEIPSPVEGVLQEVLAQVGQEIEVGGFLATLQTGAVEFSPAVVCLLKEKGLSAADAEAIPRSGEGGRLTKRDVEAFAGGGLERIPMTPLRKAIAENMVKSFYEAPHASLMTEVDVTALMRRIREPQSDGVKLTVTPFLVHAMAKALQAFPLLNASLDGETIVLKKQVNLGIAVSVDQGVMVPVIRGANSLSIPALAKKIGELAEKARTQALLPDEVREGTITLTNFGMTGVLMGTPIIRSPEVAIVGVGAIAKRVAVMPDDSLAIRQMMYVTLTFDHRVLDGLYGCGFLGELKRILQDS